MKITKKDKIAFEKRVIKEINQNRNFNRELEKELGVQIDSFKWEKTIHAFFYRVFGKNKTLIESKKEFIKDYWLDKKNKIINEHGSYFTVHPYVRAGFVNVNDNYKICTLNKIKFLQGVFGAIDITCTYPSILLKGMPYGKLLKEKPDTPYFEFLKIHIISAHKKKNAKYIPNFLYQPRKSDKEIYGPADELTYVSDLTDVVVYYIKEEWDFICNFYDIEAEIETEFYIKKKIYLVEEANVLWKMKSGEWKWNLESPIERIWRDNIKGLTVASIGYTGNGVIDKQKTKETGVKTYKKTCQIVYSPIDAVVTMYCRIHIWKTILKLLFAGAIWHLSATDSIFFEAKKIEVIDGFLTVNDVKICKYEHTFGNFYGTGEGKCNHKLTFTHFWYHNTGTYLAWDDEVGAWYKVRWGEIKLSREKFQKQRKELFKIVVQERKSNALLKEDEKQSHTAYQIFKETYLWGTVNPNIETPAILICETIMKFNFMDIVNHFEIISELMKKDFFIAYCNKEDMYQKYKNVNKCRNTL